MHWLARSRSVVLLLIVFCTAGCSVKMAYNNVDRLIRWGVSDYVDLTREQKDLLQSEVEKIHAWHRRNHLPQYSAYIQNMATQLPDGVTEDQVAQLFEQFELWVADVEERFNPLVIDVMVSLSDEQIAELPEKLKKSNAEFAKPERDQPLRESQLQWAEEFGEGLKNFTGRLNQEQRNYLERRSLEYQPERELWAEYRWRFQSQLLSLLAKRHDKDAFGRDYRALVDARESFYGAQLRAVFDNNQRLNRQVTAHILSNLTERQSIRFVDALIDLSEDFSELAVET